jgi:catechol 2,3-dioxygenase-like lactoylglutathione lyase family enzyme
MKLKRPKGVPVIDHLSVVVSDFEKSKAFYLQALAPTGHSRLVELPAAHGEHSGSAGFCHDDGSDVWIRQGDAIRPPLHIAFRVSSRAAVDAFHQAALAAGGTDNGAPGLRPHYHPHYYGAYVLDPDGHNIEAVCHEAQ